MSKRPKPCVDVDHLPNLSCAFCHRTARELGAGFSVIQKIKPVQYCSEECRANSWAKLEPHYHKASYGQVIALQCTQVTDESHPNAHPSWKKVRKEDMIYYVETWIPHLYEIKITGPFFPLNATYAQLESEFRACKEGRYHMKPKTVSFSD
jgi:hypothetical protein